MVTAAPPGWEVRHLAGPAGDLHAEPLPAVPTRAIWVLDATAPALVLGTTQGEQMVDAVAAASAGIDVVRRRSGGGAVLVVPGDVAWVDVLVPAGDPLWDDDVGRAAHWVGRTWQAALADLGLADSTVHDGALICGPLGRLVCFGTVGAGEVTVTAPNGALRKVVGVSQRRTRAAARFQCAVYRRWDPAPLVGLLGIEPDGARALDEAAMGTGHGPAELVDAFLGHLPG